MSQEINMINEEDPMHAILLFYQKKPDIPYKHIEFEYMARDGEFHDINFTYKTHYNFANPVHSTIRRYRLYIDTRKATENDLRRLM